MTKAFLHLNASCSIYFPASWQRGRMYPSFSILSAVEMVIVVDCSWVPAGWAGGASPLPSCTHSSAGTDETMLAVCFLQGHSGQGSRGHAPPSSAVKPQCFLSGAWGEQPRFYIKIHIWFCSIPRHPNHLFCGFLFIITISLCDSRHNLSPWGFNSPSHGSGSEKYILGSSVLRASMCSAQTRAQVLGLTRTLKQSP